MSEAGLSIDPDTKVATLLDHYPELEDVLIAMAPPFKKLKNPILRKSVARVASLRQAAAVAGLSVGEVVNALRRAIGQETIEEDSTSVEVAYFGDRPEWFDPARVVHSIDERQVDPETMPLTTVMGEAKRLQPGQILVLVTNFLPAPGIDIIRKKGYRVWTVREGAELIKTYISTP
ncbi:MAG: DUF1858 domain-containing protein [bacterium]|nr:DUF1858 domain-containing protein [bacterium]